MANNEADDDLINQLQARIQRLEISEINLQNQVRNLQQQVRNQRQQRQHGPQLIQAVAVPDNEQEPLNQRFRDRDGTTINLGDRVYMITRGVHRERRGTIIEFRLPWVIIEDRTGTIQRRAAHNVRRIL